MMQAAEYGSLHNPVSDRQTVSVLVGRDLPEPLSDMNAQLYTLRD